MSSGEGRRGGQKTGGGEKWALEYGTARNQRLQEEMINELWCTPYKTDFWTAWSLEVTELYHGDHDRCESLSIAIQVLPERNRVKIVKRFGRQAN